MTIQRSKYAFSLIELVFVIVILGIVSSIGASLIARVYDSYITQRALHNASMRTDLAIKQIARRLTYRISTSVIGRVPNPLPLNPVPATAVAGDYLAINQLPPGNAYQILEWISYDNDGFNMTSTAARVPAWSGFCDVNASSRTVLSTPGSKLGTLSAMLVNLGGTIADAAIIFNSIEYNATKNYHPSTMGFDAVLPASTITPVASLTGDTTINIGSPNQLAVFDQYKLVWSAYSIVPVIHADDPDTTDINESKVFDLDLHYNYQPWLGDKYDDAGTKVSTLVTNVTVFKFKGVGETVRIKLCVQENISKTETVNICKEKAVIR